LRYASSSSSKIFKAFERWHIKWNISWDTVFISYENDVVLLIIITELFNLKFEYVKPIFRLQVSKLFKAYNIYLFGQFISFKVSII
jgi:hypothetical protein